MEKSRTQFEVHVFRSNHWVVDELYATEAAARERGRALLRNLSCEGYRIIRDRLRLDGHHNETEVHSEFRKATSLLTVASIEQAPSCAEPEDLYRPPARIAVSRLMRQYLEQIHVTPTELLYHPAELRRLMEKDNLVPTAVSRVAALQCAADDRSGHRIRRDQLYDLINAVAERGRKLAGGGDLPSPRALGMAEVRARCGRKAGGAEPEPACLAALARDLVGLRSWFGKLGCLLDLVERADNSDDDLALLDGVIADVVGIPAAVQDLLGFQPNLASALLCLADLSRGRLSAGAQPLEEPLVRLNQAIRERGLPTTRSVLIEVAGRQLKGGQPLDRRAEPRLERSAFDRLLHTFAAGEDSLLGPPIAEALVSRYGRFLEAGGATGRRQAITEVLGRFTVARDRVRFLAVLAGSDCGIKQAEDVVDHLRRLTHPGTAGFELVHGQEPVEVNLVAITRLYQQVQGSPLADQGRSMVADQIDQILADYIRRYRVIETLDNPSDHLRERAKRLIGLCLPTVIASPKSLALVRRRVITLLRQPGFEDSYVDDLGDADLRARTLRDFYALLGAAGFR